MLNSMKINAIALLSSFCIEIMKPAGLLHVCDTKLVSADRFDSRWDKSKAVAKDRTCKVTFRTKMLHFTLQIPTSSTAVWRIGVELARHSLQSYCMGRKGVTLQALFVFEDFWVNTIAACLILHGQGRPLYHR